MKITRCFFLSVFFLVFFLDSKSQEKETDKIKSSSEVLTEFKKIKNKIPSEIFKSSEGLVIVPEMINAGLVVAGKRGNGIALIKNDDGSWSNPVFVMLSGGSVGAQIGVQTIDLILIFRKKETLEKMVVSGLTIGGDISAAAGPVGRSSSAATDFKFDAEVYSYSKAKGLFAGVSLSGTALRADAKADASFYGKEIAPKTIFTDKDKINSPETKTLRENIRSLYN